MKKVTLLFVSLLLIAFANAQNLQPLQSIGNNSESIQYGSVEYYESMRISYQTKMDWIRNNPEEDALAQQNGWYETAEANIQSMEQLKALALSSPNGIYVSPSVKNTNTQPEPGGNLCDLAAPFCTDYSYDFPCGVDAGTAQSGPDYDCLYSQPNPAWYFMEIDNPGTLIMSLTAAHDIDFIIWGPFVGEGCTFDCDETLLTGSNVVDCSYSSTNMETPEIGPNSTGGSTTALAGGIYVFLITNYSNSTQNFSLTATGGTATTNCSCMECPMEQGSLTVTAGPCEPHQNGSTYYSVYDLSGSVNMNTTIATVPDSVAFYIDGVWYSSVSAPIPNPVTFDYIDLPADGNSHTVTVYTYYLDDDGIVTSCSDETTYSAPDNCAQCAAVAGPDLNACGTSITMQGQVEPWDVNTHWTVSCPNISVATNNSPTTVVNYSGSFPGGGAVSCELIWTITNELGLTCNDTANITFKPIPTATFTLTSDVCDGETVYADYTSTSIPINNYDWTYSSATELTGTDNDHIQLVYNNAIGQNTVCLTVTSDLGCVSNQVCHNTLVKQIPTCDFTIGGPICSGAETTVIYNNDNNTAIPCGSPSIYNWNFNNQITATQGNNGQCEFTLTADNLNSNEVYYPISLQVTSNGCTSDICEDSLLVFPEGVQGCCITPTAYAGEDTSLCIFDHVLSANVAGGGNYGYWEAPGNISFFPNSDMGSETSAGNPHAHITTNTSGTYVLTWIEVSGSCRDTDYVSITFLEQPYVTFGQDGYAFCGHSGLVEANANILGTANYQWLNPYSEVTLTPINTFNPTMTLNMPYSYGNYIVQCVATVNGQCRDTAELKVSFIEPPAAIAGDYHSSCGTSDTLHAQNTFTGYWTVLSSPASGTNCSAVFTNHITGQTDIYDPSAVVSVTCNGNWVFQWHEQNGICEGTDTVTINFAPASIELNTTPEQKTCLDYSQVHVDTTGYSNDLWLWSIDPNWPYANDNLVTFDPYDAAAIVYSNFTNEVFGDSGYFTVPMIVTLYAGGCASTDTSSVTFYQAPTPYIGRDTLVCSDQISFDID
ncbi:MAG: hypothetical protein JXR60_08355, partial [Bacteroidales bacterium]|nr:hypothetical protein [Bacteroidales bacterium]